MVVAAVVSSTVGLSERDCSRLSSPEVRFNTLEVIVVVVVGGEKATLWTNRSTFRRPSQAKSRAPLASFSVTLLCFGAIGGGVHGDEQATGESSGRRRRRGDKVLSTRYSLCQCIPRSSPRPPAHLSITTFVGYTHRIITIDERRRGVRQDFPDDLPTVSPPKRASRSPPFPRLRAGDIYRTSLPSALAELR